MTAKLNPTRRKSCDDQFWRLQGLPEPGTTVAITGSDQRTIYGPIDRYVTLGPILFVDDTRVLLPWHTLTRMIWPPTV